MTDHRSARRVQLAAALAADELDALVINHLPNIRFLTGFSGTAGVLACTDREMTLVTDFRYREQAAAEAGDVARIEIVSRDVWGRVVDVLAADQTVRRVGFESHAVTVETSSRFRHDRLDFAATKGIVEGFRTVKDPDEVDRIRRAAQLAMEALETTLSQIRLGQRECDVAGMLERELRMRGSEWHPFPTIVASGPRTALPHARTSERELAAGEWLLLDFGAQVDGYCADITRTVLLGGPPDERQRTVYELVREAQHQARSGVRAGMTGQEADALARSVIHARGFGDAFGHSLGHGLGLEVHETPSLSPANDRDIPAGAVVTIEPGVYFPGWGGVRLEDDVHIASSGPELLSDGLTDLRQVA